MPSQPYDWHDKAILAAKESLKLSIHDTRYAPFLEQIPPRPLLKLLDLHRIRRDGFRYLINEPERFTIGNVEHRCTCGSQPLAHLKVCIDFRDG